MRDEEHRDPSLTGPPGISEVSPPEEAAPKRSQGKRQVHRDGRPVMERSLWGIHSRCKTATGPGWNAVEGEGGHVSWIIGGTNTITALCCCLAGGCPAGRPLKLWAAV